MYPYESGDVIVLGPGIFAAKDGSVLNWRGENYVRANPVKNPDPYEDYKQVPMVDRTSSPSYQPNAGEQ